MGFGCFGSTDIWAYIRERNREYGLLRYLRAAGYFDRQKAPPTWPADQCYLTTLPTELFLQICRYLYQADLFHLAVTCRTLSEPALSVLYTQDVHEFDSLSLRWACSFGHLQTLNRALQHGASLNDAFYGTSDAGCNWGFASVIGESWDGVGWTETPLNIAIYCNQPEVVRLLLDRGANPNGIKIPFAGEEMPEGILPIHFAVGRPFFSYLPLAGPANPIIARYLLDAGANPNAAVDLLNRWRWPRMAYTPLLMSLHPQVPLETTKLLLDRGATAKYSRSDPEERKVEGLVDYLLENSFLDLSGSLPISPHLDRYLQTTRYIVCHVIEDAPLDIEKLELLLARGAIYESISVTVRTAYRPVTLPVIYRYWSHPRILTILEKFIAHGADIARWTKFLIPPVLSVLWWAQGRLTEHRSHCTDPHPFPASHVIRRAREIITIMAEATLDGEGSGEVRKSSIINYMVPTTGDCEVDQWAMQPPLCFACGPLGLEGASSLIDVLLRYGAAINARDSKGRSALHHAAMSHEADRVGHLLRFLGGPEASGLVIDARDLLGWTPLHYACFFSPFNTPETSTAIVRMLIYHGANVRAVTRNGWTPLSLAVYAGNAHLVRLLIDHGAHDDDLYRHHPVGAPPVLVSVGRIFFHHEWGPGLLSSNPREIPTTPALGKLREEIMARRQRIASLVEDNFGIRLPIQELTPVLPLPHPEHEYHQLCDLFQGYTISDIHAAFPGVRLELRDLSSCDFDGLSLSEMLESYSFKACINGTLDVVIAEYGPQRSTLLASDLRWGVSA